MSGPGLVEYQAGAWRWLSHRFHLICIKSLNAERRQIDLAKAGERRAGQ